MSIRRAPLAAPTQAVPMMVAMPHEGMMVAQTGEEYDIGTGFAVTSSGAIGFARDIEEQIKQTTSSNGSGVQGGKESSSTTASADDSNKVRSNRDAFERIRVTCSAIEPRASSGKKGPKQSAAAHEEDSEEGDPLIPTGMPFGDDFEDEDVINTGGKFRRGRGKRFPQYMPQNPQYMPQRPRAAKSKKNNPLKSIERKVNLAAKRMAIMHTRVVETYRQCLVHERQTQNARTDAKGDATVNSKMKKMHIPNIYSVQEKIHENKFVGLTANDKSTFDGVVERVTASYDALRAGVESVPGGAKIKNDMENLTVRVNLMTRIEKMDIGGDKKAELTKLLWAFVENYRAAHEWIKKKLPDLTGKGSVHHETTKPSSAQTGDLTNFMKDKALKAVAQKEGISDDAMHHLVSLGARFDDEEESDDEYDGPLLTGAEMFSHEEHGLCQCEAPQPCDAEMDEDGNLVFTGARPRRRYSGMYTPKKNTRNGGIQNSYNGMVLRARGFPDRMSLSAGRRLLQSMGNGEYFHTGNHNIRYQKHHKMFYRVK